jgi:hypothetical protein
MDELDDLDEGTSGTVFRDVLMLALIGFVAIVIMLLPHLKRTKEESDEHKSPGNVVVEMHWPSDKPFDVDLWVQAPGEYPVGFWNQGSRVFNLLRDDLGSEGDATDENYEITYSRGIPKGEYIVNVHMYGPLPRGAEIPVKVVVSVRKKYDTTRQLLETVVNLNYRNQEETAYRFKLTSDGDLVPDSINYLRRRMITAPRLKTE